MEWITYHRERRLKAQRRARWASRLPAWLRRLLGLEARLELDTPWVS